MRMIVDEDLINRAYNIGRDRGTSLSLGYYIAPDGATIFCQNPNSNQGVFVGAVSGFSDLPDDYHPFDMSDALATPVATESAMVISESSCLGGECFKTYEVVDFNPNCDAIYWEGETLFRGRIATIRWESGGGDNEVEVNSKAPKEIIQSLKSYIWPEG